MLWKPRETPKTLKIVCAGTLAAILLTGCETPSQGVSGLCPVLHALLRDYSEAERLEIAAAIEAFPAVRKPVETAVAVREVYRGRCASHL